MKGAPLSLSLISFFPEFHMYMLNGIVLPSVTQVVSWVVHKDYSGVPTEILDAKADYGNRVHEWVERYALTGEKLEQTDLMKISTDQVVELFDEKKVDIESTEQVVGYQERYAGTYDMFGHCGEASALFDIKTTAKYDSDYLEWQLGMYKLALEESGTSVQDCYCLWMPKGKRVKLIKVNPKSKEEILQKLDDYEQSLLEGLPF